MRQFAASGFRLWNLSPEAKVIYSFFCVLSLFAIASSVLLYEDLVGPTFSAGQLSRVGAYYYESRVGPPVGSVKAAAPATGPDIVLPADAETETASADLGPAAGKLIVAMPFRKLLEVTHFHLFTVPVFLLILTHLFLLTALSSGWRLFFILAGWVTGSLHILAPWLVHFGGVRWSLFFPLSGAGFFVSTLVLCLYPIFVMWRKPVRRTRSLSAAPDEAEGGE